MGQMCSAPKKPKSSTLDWDSQRNSSMDLKQAPSNTEINEHNMSITSVESKATVATVEPDPSPEREPELTPEVKKKTKKEAKPKSPVNESGDGKRLSVQRARSRKHHPDGLRQFLDEGGVLETLIEDYVVPLRWDALVAEQFREGFDEIFWDEFCSRRTANRGINVDLLDEDGNVRTVDNVFTSTVRLCDDVLSTKRIFLAFFDLRLEAMRPEAFINWCAEHEMHNSVAEYRSLYYVSKFHFMSGRVLQACANWPGAMRVELSDRFTEADGIYRGIRFYADSRFRVLQMRNALLAGMNVRAAKNAVTGNMFSAFTPEEMRQHPLISVTRRSLQQTFTDENERSNRADSVM